MRAAPAPSRLRGCARFRLGLEVVLADGRVLHGLNKLKKDNTGYDLKNLFIGAEGTLGIITAAVVKLFPAPKTVETAFAGLPSPQAALALLHLVQERTNRAVTSFELISRTVMEFALRHGPGCRDPLAAPHPWYVLLELSSAAEQDLQLKLEEILEFAIEQGLVNDATVAASLEQRPPSGICAKSCPKSRSRKAARSSTTSRCRLRPCRIFCAKPTRRSRH